MKVRIFYSWQTTTVTKFNKNFILSCIEKAVKKLTKKPEFKNIEFIVQEGVRGESGSPQVASKIIDERIPNCDIFIADLSVVNSINQFRKFIRWASGDSFKPFQNNNVINEHGVATNAIGLQRMIGVLNSEYGSPNKNPDNIPFDLRHIRFPIEYKYSNKTDSKERERTQTQLVTDLASAINDATITALQFQKNKHNPLIVWSDWEQSILVKERFIKNKKVDELSNLILEGIKNPKESVRILGLSGLGKTRILFEIFRPNPPDENSILLSSRLLYINCNLHPTADYQSIFRKLANEQDDRILILDNCSKAIHRQALNFTSKESNLLSLISLDSNPEEIDQDKINGVNYLVIKKEDLADVVEEILTRDFGNLEKEKLEKIREFSQGIPLMAVLLGDSVKKGQEFIGKLDDKELLDKLLGQKGQGVKERTILKSCSIFNFFGFYDELASQVEFIATNKNITSLDGDSQVLINDFNETCQYFLKREIFEKRGRFLGMRPFPLAISLAQEWLEPCTAKRLIDVITDIAKLEEPNRGSLSQALAEQMKYLGYDDKAIQIVEKITGPSSPFDNAEVLNTELGSRLFRSFVEVNPISVCNNLKRVFGAKSTEDLLEIRDGRRNLVWVLEKLCFDKRTFPDGAKLLYSFAVAENETWANNATGQFIHLFNILLSGTEATLSEKWKIIEWGIEKNDDRYFAIAIKAMKSGLNYGHFSRDGGAETQGSRRLYDNQPNWNEIIEYWNRILSKLVEVIKSESKYSSEASEAINNSLRSIIRARLGSVVLPYVSEISKYKEYDWDSGLQALKFARKYEKAILPEQELNQINELIKLLSKDDFITRYTMLSRSYHLDNDETYSSDKVIAAMTSLANEFIDTNIPWEQTLPVFYSSQQVFSYHFGKRLFELIQSDEGRIDQFIEHSLNAISLFPKEERNVVVLGGFIAESSSHVKDKFYETIFQSDKLEYLLFYFLSIDPDGKKYFDLLFRLVDEKRCELSNFYNFTYSRSLQKMEFNELDAFKSKLFSCGNEGYEIVFDLFFDLAYGNEQLKKTLFPIYKECILKLGVNKTEKRQLDGYKWAHAIRDIVSNSEEGEFAMFINKSVIDSISWENSYHLDHDMESIYETLVETHFKMIWPYLSNALLSKDEEYIKFYGLKHILGSRIGGVGRSVGVLFEGDLDEIFKWCESNKPLAPARLAELAPIFDKNNTEYSQWHPVALRLIDEFGEIEEVQRGLSTNMGTFSWSGSVVPLLEGKISLFKSISSHKSQKISQWATSYISYLEKDIEREKNRDEESFLI